MVLRAFVYDIDGKHSVFLCQIIIQLGRKVSLQFILLNDECLYILTGYFNFSNLFYLLYSQNHVQNQPAAEGLFEIKQKSEQGYKSQNLLYRNIKE